MINGKAFSWEDITIDLPHGTLVRVSKIEYSDEKDLKEVYGRGSNPVAYGSGNYKSNFKLTLGREEYERLKDYCIRQKIQGFYQLPPFTTTVCYANADRPTVIDFLHQCKFTKTSTSADQGGEKVDVELDGLILGGVEWNGLAGEQD